MTRQAREQVGLHQLQLACMREEGLARDGCPQALAAHQQALTQRLLERLDAQRDRRQRQVQLFGRGAETAMLEHGDQGFELTGVEHDSSIS